MKTHIAVVTPKYRNFINWVEENKNENELYYWIYSKESLIGRTFDRVEKLFDYFEIKEIDDLLYDLEKRTVK